MTGPDLRSGTHIGQSRRIGYPSADQPEDDAIGAARAPWAVYLLKSFQPVSPWGLSSLLWRLDSGSSPFSGLPCRPPGFPGALSDSEGLSRRVSWLVFLPIGWPRAAFGFKD